MRKLREFMDVTSSLWMTTEWPVYEVNIWPWIHCARLIHRKRSIPAFLCHGSTWSPNRNFCRCLLWNIVQYKCAKNRLRRSFQSMNFRLIHFMIIVPVYITVLLFSEIFHLLLLLQFHYVLYLICFQGIQCFDEYTKIGRLKRSSHE